MYNVPSHIDWKISSNRSRLWGQWISFTKHLSSLLDNVFTFPNLQCKQTKSWRQESFKLNTQFTEPPWNHCFREIIQSPLRVIYLNSSISTSTALNSCLVKFCRITEPPEKHDIIPTVRRVPQYCFLKKTSPPNPMLTSYKLWNRIHF